MSFEAFRDEMERRFGAFVRFDPLTQSLFSTDASLFQIKPFAVAVPNSVDQLRELVQYADEHAISIIPRGAGTGVAGEALGSGIILDLSTHFRSILEINERSVRVQTGVVYAQLNRELKKQHRRLAPNPTGGEACTIGGMLASNASGANAIRYGTIADHLVDMQVLWADGSIETIGPDQPSSRATDLESILEPQRELILKTRTKSLFDRCGYRLRQTLGGKQADLSQLMIGSEGTLGIILEATLNTIPLASGRAAALFVFTQLEAALRAAQLMRQSPLVACELMDRRLLFLARSQPQSIGKEIPISAEAVLLIECEEDSPEQARLVIEDLIDKVQNRYRLSIYAKPAYETTQIDRMWSLRESALPSLYSYGPGPRPTAFIEDLGVHPDQLPEFIAKLQTIFRKWEVSASMLIHAATGQVHARPILDLSDFIDQEKLWPLANEVHHFTIEFGGTISSQHGAGIARTPWVEKQVGPLMPIYRDVKRLFDPRNILNPGKIVSLDPSRPSWPLRQTGFEPLQESAKTQLNWSMDEIHNEVNRCNGCGDCRTQSQNKRMCPIFRIEPIEEATPRAKANLVRGLLTHAKAEEWDHREIRRVASLCVNCKMCASECDAKVDIPSLMLETRAMIQSQHGLRRGEWFASRLEALARWGSNVPVVMNYLLGRIGIRWFVEKLFGFSRKRQLTAFARRNFIKLARRKGWTQKHSSLENQPKVAYFVDVYASYFDISIAEATVRVLQHQGVNVFVPEHQLGSGMAALAMGDIERARDVSWHHLRIFGELIREGYQIICSEPTAAVMFTQDIPRIIDDADAKLLAENTKEATTYLWQMYQKKWMRPGLQPLPISVGHHVPCHIKALKLGTNGPRLLELIPDFRVHTIDVSCSGMAGTFGFQARNFERSLQAGEPMLQELRRAKYLFGSTECSTCRMQMEQGSGKRTFHPMQYLALAYGLMPELANKMKQPLRPRLSW